MASRRDMEQVLCCHVKEALECGDMEFVKAAKIFEKAYNKLDDEIKENAQRNYRTLIYPYVRFSMVATHSKNAPIGNIIKALSPGAAKVAFSLLVYTQSQYFSVSISEMSEISGMTVKSVRKAMGELVDYHVLSVTRKSTNRRKAVYRWDSRFVRVGKDATIIDDGNVSTLKEMLRHPANYVSTRKKLPVDDDGHEELTTVLIPV